MAIIYEEVILRVGDVFYRPLPLPRGGRCWEVSGDDLKANVWNVGLDEKSWPLWGGLRPLVEVRQR